MHLLHTKDVALGLNSYFLKGGPLYQVIEAICIYGEEFNSHNQW